MQQVARDHNHQVWVVTVPWVQHLFGVEHQSVQRLEIASGTNSDFARSLDYFIHHAIRGAVTNFLQPADVDVLPQRVGVDVGGDRCAGAVEADHDAVQPLALGDSAAQACLEVFELGPLIQQLVGEGRVIVGLLTVVGVFGQRAAILGIAAGTASGVGAAGNGAVHTQQQRFARLLGNAEDVDPAEHVGGFLNPGFQRLLDGGLYVELLHCLCHAVELGNLAAVGVEGNSGLVAHEVLRPCVRVGLAMSALGQGQ